MTAVRFPVPWHILLAAQRFRPARADYYDYLADLMEASEGRKTLRDIFVDDAQRYGRRPRGVLSAHWADNYQEMGGDLYATFRATLPADDLVLLRMAQRGGAGVLEQVLRDLAGTTRLVDAARQVAVSTLATAVAAVMVVVFMVAAMPVFTVPRLKRAFAMVPDEFLGAGARRLFTCADLVQGYGIHLLAAVALAVYAAAWSLPNFTGPGRAALDRVLVWRVYRDFHGIRFLASLAAMVKRRGNVSTALRAALELQVDGSGPWRRWHVERMLARIDDGRVGSETFDTGLVDRDTLWFLADLTAALGLDAALQRTRQRLEARSLQNVARRAAMVRWCLLLAAVAAALAIVFWHVAVVNDMRAAMTNYYSSR